MTTILKMSANQSFISVFRQELLHAISYYTTEALPRCYPISAIPSLLSEIRHTIRIPIRKIRPSIRYPNPHIKSLSGPALVYNKNVIAIHTMQSAYIHVSGDTVNPVSPYHFHGALSDGGCACGRGGRRSTRARKKRHSTPHTQKGGIHSAHSPPEGGPLMARHVELEHVGDELAKLLAVDLAVSVLVKLGEGALHIVGRDALLEQLIPHA